MTRLSTLRTGPAIREVIISSGANVFAAAVSLLVLAVTAHALGPNGRGVYASATSLVTLVGTVGSLSLGQAMLHHVTGRPREEWRDQVAGTLLGLVVALTVAGWLAALALQVATDGRLLRDVPGSSLAIAFAALPFMLWFDQGRYLLFALGLVREFGASQFVGYGASLVALVSLVYVVPGGLTGALVAWVVLYLVLAGFGYRALRLAITRVRFSADMARAALRSSSSLHWTTIGTYVHLQSSVLILSHFRDPSEVAFYQLATQVTAMGTLIPIGVSSTAYEQTSRLGPDGAWAVQRRLIAGTMLLAVATAAIGAIAAPLGVRIVAGADFLPAVPLVRILMLALVGMTLSIMMGSQWIGRGLFRLTARLSIGLALLSLALDFALIPRYGMYGALASTLAVYALGFLVNAGFAIRIERRWRAELRHAP